MEQLKQDGVTAVIPVYNEADNIDEVLFSLRDVTALSHILVVDAGSDDETAVVVQQHQAEDERLSILSLSQNQGKGAAMFAGAAASHTELLLFLDGDLKAMRPSHIQTLIQPVQQALCAMTVGLFEDAGWQANITRHVFPFLGTQRCLRWPLFSELQQEKINGLSIETALSLHAWVNHYPVQYVMWPGITQSHASRMEKRTDLLGHSPYVKMWWEMGQYVSHFMVQQMRTNSIEAYEANSLPYQPFIK